MQDFRPKTNTISAVFTQDEEWMRIAIDAARQAAVRGEVPVGSIIVDSRGSMLAAASNLTITNTDPTAHAEILALREAAAKVGNYRLTGVTVYSTIEPCAMCAGALVNARVERLVFGARDERFGAVETHFQLCSSEKLNHRVEVASGVLADECRELMRAFFRARR
ncbi:MAG: tRNA adenosine(34) deaminase TadA [Pyrinomonadaceae bacterium]